MRSKFAPIAACILALLFLACGASPASAKLCPRILALLFLACGASPASAQLCPRASSTGPNSPSRAQPLEGRLVYHDGIRQWFELRLDRPKCGQHSIQLMSMDDHRRKPLEIFRGCRIRSTGPIEFSPTGYFTLDLYQDYTSVRPVGACARKPPFPKEVTGKPDPHIRSYTVEMDLDYRPGDHPIVFHVRSGGRALRPWQAYARYMLTGGFILYGHCADGFVVDRVYGTPEAHPFDFDDPRSPENMAAFDPESAAQKGKHDLRLGYRCVRPPVTKH